MKARTTPALFELLTNTRRQDFAQYVSTIPGFADHYFQIISSQLFGKDANFLLNTTVTPFSIENLTKVIISKKYFTNHRLTFFFFFQS